MNEAELYKLFYIDKNYSEIKELLKNNSDFRSFNMLGKIQLWTGNIKEAYKYFNKAGNIYGCCYCKFINKELDEAKVLSNLIKESSSTAIWLACLINIVQDKEPDIVPSYFQIRNFYEQDLEMLFLYKNNEYISKIIRKNQYFEYFNREIYKYSARVLMNHDITGIAEELLKKSLDIFFRDPETHYMLGEIYMAKGEKQKAKSSFILSNEVNGNYYPAIKKLKDLMN